VVRTHELGSSGLEVSRVGLGSNNFGRRLDLEGTRAWLPTDDLEVPATPPGCVRLLPYFDAYTVGTHPRDVVFPGLAKERALSRGQAGNVPVLLVDGIVGGIWHQRRAGGLLHVQVEPFGELGPSQLRELDGQVTRLGAILGAEAQLTIGPVEAGKHL
jgi:hypothetical protein